MLPDSFPDTSSSRTTVLNDLTAGVVVFFVALPLCLGVALASNAPLLSGVLAGVIGGVLVGALSGTKLAVSGPAAGLTAVVAAQVAALGSFHVFLMALVVAGLIQIALGMARAGSVSAFFPSSVIKGLLTGIGVLLILKQIPLVLGHAPDATYDTSFLQSQHPNPFFEIWEAFREMHLGSAVIGFVSIGMLILWSRWKSLRKSYAPAPLAVVLLGTCLSLIFQRLGGRWVVGTSHRVQVPVVENLVGYFRALPHPDFSQWSNPAIYSAALAIAAVASLETLLNLEAIDKLDPKRRTSPRSRELMAQGAGNLVSGLLGGLPVTLAIARSSVNIQSGAQTKLATIIQGCLLLSSAVLLSPWLNLIPLSCLAAILLVTGFKLARPSTVKQMWGAGRWL